MKTPDLAKSVLPVVAGAVLLAAPAMFAHGDPLQPGPFRKVDSVWVDANVCTSGIEDQLRQRGFQVASSPLMADASLVVDVYDHVTYIRDTARYTVMLERDDRYLLLADSGMETARSMGGLCDNIGDSIAESMDKMG